MRKFWIGLIPLFLLEGFAAGQDSIRHRIILIGDAGFINKQQQAVISDAASRIISGQTTVLFLGNNIFPRGLSFSGDSIMEKQVLQSQYQPMRSKGAPVYFIPGNRDWDNSGRNGLSSVRKQWEYLRGQNDPLLQLVPANGCPDPVEININDQLVIIVFDSEWWLFPYSKLNFEADCDCTTKEEVAAKLDDLFFKNRFKVIILASHHPFQSYGIRGGNFTWKDHIFPFTALNKNLYIPLPVVGSLYPLLRRSFTSPEDLHHPLYKEMIRKVNNVFGSFPNLTYAAGHEQGLQLIKSNHLQIVSGSGSQASSALRRKSSVFAQAQQGYVTIDLLPNNDTKFDYYTYGEAGAKIAFSYTHPYQDLKTQEEASYEAITKDSIEVSAYAPYDHVSGLHRNIFGEGYRKEWGVPTKLPVIRISELKGGLTPYKRGGGHQTLSLRLKDKDGKEWVLRSIEKFPDVLLPEGLRETFARDIARDAMSAQHPYGPLVVPILANAVRVPHANPVIGYVAPDKQLGIYQKTFANRLCLLEEREPFGNSDNTPEMLQKLNQDNDNSVDSVAFFRARLLDLYLGDWDRHDDQWRWYDEKKGSEKKYIAIPRDRDQAFYRNGGFLPRIASTRAIAPFLRGFRADFKKTNEFFLNGQTLDNRFLNQLDHETWIKISHEFSAALTDSVLETGLSKLPPESYRLRHDDLLNKMKKRRDHLADAAEKYYFFINKIADIRVSDKNELVEISDATGGGVLLTIHKLTKERKVKEQLYSKVFTPSVTKEIRLFIGRGDDSVVVNTQQTSIKFRIVGGEGKKDYNVIKAGRKMHVYGKETNVFFDGMSYKIKKHLSNDSANTAILPTRRYNVTVPMLLVGLNPDDGLLFGLSFKHTHQGFRKLPYASVQQAGFAHSFSTRAYRFNYHGEWLGYNGKPDFIMQLVARAPNNTQNFFGRGNETEFEKTENYKKYYRARFTIYQADPAVRWRGDKNSFFSIGPSLQHYSYDQEENKGRLTSDPSLIGSYDSSTLDKARTHLGLVINFIRNRKNHPLLPGWGSYVHILVQGYMGLNSYSKSFIQIIPEIALYKSLNLSQTIVLSERLGGGITLGNTTFYQSLFLGGHQNLQGYRQYRFAGQHSIYNNLELRIKLAEFASYILPGQFGFTGFYDIGRVWEKNEDSHKWHNGIGGGFYFAPAQLVVLQLVAGFSVEGWYPNFTMGFRF
ncbi:MAG: hypothetical protein E6H09_00700 [Bacteroidetes bacterium]|nr:MAG: hypothetical protein E6H09_00700 [Bacteroidota bacterium]